MIIRGKRRRGEPAARLVFLRAVALGAVRFGRRVRVYREALLCRLDGTGKLQAITELLEGGQLLQPGGEGTVFSACV